MFAVIEAGGKQYHVKVGDVIKTEKVLAEPSATVEIDKVLALGDKIGAPYIENAKVKAQVLEQKRSDKVIIFKKNRRHNYRRKKGHKQHITAMRISEIIG